MKLREMEMVTYYLSKKTNIKYGEEKNEVEMKSKGDRIDLSKDSNSSNLFSNEDDPTTSKM